MSAADPTAAVLATERVPRLVLRFAVVTAAVVALTAAATVTVVRHAYDVQGEHNAIVRARLTTQLIGSQLRPGDLATPLPPARRRLLNRLLRAQVLGDGTVGARFYDSRGVVTYSVGTVPRALRATTRPLARQASAGLLVSRIDRSRLGSGRVLSVYVPINFGPAGVRGVLALEQDYAPIAAAARRSSLVIAGVLELLLLLLCLLLAPMLGRASKRIQAQVDALARVATHDELTGLPNRVGFRRAVQQIAADESASVALMLVDLDSFHVNHTLGPERADTLLVNVAARLRLVANALFVARLGEDEFGLIVPASNEHAVTRFALDIRQALAEPIDVGGQRVALEARSGCALLPRDGTDPELLLRRAGIALTIAKQHRSATEIYDEEHDHSDISRVTFTAELREALRDGQFVVHYQPQADLATGAIRGAEALLRWNHPMRGQLAAGEFIAAAEQTSVMGDIGRFVLETAVRQWQEWKSLGATLDIAVNLTALDLLDPQLPGEIETLLRRHGMPPEYLALEITERALLRDEQRTRQTLEDLHRIGTRLTVDDYGTGYSSLAYLRNLRAEQVKLDRTFIDGVSLDAANSAIVRSTIELAHTLGATVVAEGVETREQWDHLAGLGCDIAQGYLISQPVSAEELIQLVSGRRLRIVA